MKKLLAIMIAAAMLLTFAACNPDEDPVSPPANDVGNNDNNNNNNNNQADTEDNTLEVDEEEGEQDAITGAIAVITREDGSGTRGAFVELFDVRIENAEGKKVDDVRPDADVQNATGAVIGAVAGNKQAIGYISLGSLDDKVKALKIDGAEASVENVLNGSYTIKRPFNIVTSVDGISDAAQDFINFIMSDEGQAVITNEKCISEGSTGPFVSNGKAGAVIIDGSSSVSPVMTKLKEAYEALVDGADIEIQTTDSGTGVTSTINGGCDIGMVSRELKDEELEQGIEDLVICLDGIAVIVHVDNPFSDATKDQIKAIFQDEGDITKWEELDG
ncbi:MAG: substrate-binding domain-containing protein [Oscillospiraceae bacterium]|nr:substrate-binding domain-containing protein [Oscillospiraceae bacterium]